MALKGVLVSGTLRGLERAACLALWHLMLSLPARCDAHLAARGGEDGGGGDRGQMWAPLGTDVCRWGACLGMCIVSGVGT